MSKIPVIIDTDVFGDPDDILAIAYLLAHPDIVDIKLIITADEHKGMRAAHLQALLKQIGQKIPVAAGKDLGNTRLFLFEDIDTKLVDFDYLSAINKVVKETVGPIVFLCQAPQSNLAEYLEKFPESVKRLEVRAMGGALDIDLGRPEHNQRGDIEAFRLVAEQTHPKLLLADQSWHDSMRFSRAHPLYKKLKQSRHPLAQAIIKNADIFYDRLYPESRFHDPILASTLLGNFVTFTPETISLESDGKMTKSDNGISLEVSTAVKYDAMLNHFTKSLENLLFKE